MNVRPILLSIVMLSPVPALAQIPFTTATCTNADLTKGVIGKKNVGETAVFIRRLATIKNEALDDFGNTKGGDNIELFCLSSSQTDDLGVLAACLSKEKCPWR